MRAEEEEAEEVNGGTVCAGAGVVGVRGIWWTDITEGGSHISGNVCVCVCAGGRAVWYGMGWDGRGTILVCHRGVTVEKT